MSNVITSQTAVITPTLITGYSSKRESHTVLHQIIDRSAPDVTLRAASLRSGSLELLFAAEDAEAASSAAEAALSEAAVFTLTSDERSTVGMPFVVQGSITRTLDDASRSAWTVAFDWAEVAP